MRKVCASGEVVEDLTHMRNGGGRVKQAGNVHCRHVTITVDCLDDLFVAAGEHEGLDLFFIQLWQRGGSSIGVRLYCLAEM